MKIGVLLPSRFEDPGEFLADARAMEAAGADSVWMADLSDGLDPMLALAAIAAVTSQLRLGVIEVSASREQIPSPLVGEGQGGGSARRTETLQQLSRQRLISPVELLRRVEVPSAREAWAKPLRQTSAELYTVSFQLDP